MNNSNTLIQITKNGMGTGSEELGLILISNYLKLSLAGDQLPKIITFYNAGVKLTCEGSPVLDSLKSIEKAGVKMIICKTCLNFFKLQDKLEVGIQGTMPDIMTLQSDADKVVNL
ncbi:sulfurtransferase-like selenium metabolism protein YedF [Ancylomarina sp. 16SWW S1-10-2]|uniref:sulfurtransferase-like selenium metabolism protein YedF n=1 Tax=Ancylomarina sp. 16SWW S1-10-2 TaxID=2499681 RepID=UPI0012AD838D|nr:sulfurtransferase-like selenium metabolism protein YedF [Ancylomarina sp. 16SWW S1-10-2]MRT94501.1 sulfurtransferase-like selenium metabolism protein YedF [Ancylomarina sp. 16SWW S1-10-2]